MPYTRPGVLKVSQPLQVLPDWLLGDYVAYCAPELEEQLNQPAGLLKAGRMHRNRSRNAAVRRRWPGSAMPRCWPGCGR